MSSSLINSIIKLANTIAKYKNTKENRKYVDELLKLRRKYREELSRDENNIDDNIISNIVLRVNDVSEAIATASTAKNTED